MLGLNIQFDPVCAPWPCVMARVRTFPVFVDVCAIQIEIKKKKKEVPNKLLKFVAPLYV